MKEKIFAITFLFYFQLSIYGQEIIDKYNLKFENSLKESPWIPILDDFKYEIDSTNKYEGKRALHFSRTYLRKEFNLNVNQTIVLPKIAKEIEVSICANNEQLSFALLKITGLDKKRRAIDCDSISLIEGGGWQKFVSKITSEFGFELLIIEIVAKESFKDKKKQVDLWIDNLNVNLDTKDIYDYSIPITNDYQQNISNNISLTPLLEIPTNNIESTNANIYGFGESVHGSKEIAKSIFNNIRNLICIQNCRLVLLEIPIDIGIRINQYIQDDAFNEDIKGIISGYHIDNIEFYSFLDWVKRFNLKSENKVYIFGFDNYSSYSPRHIKNFISERRTNLKETDTLLSMINSNNYRSIPLRYLEKNKNLFLPSFGTKSYLTLLQCLKIRTDSLCRLIPLFQSFDWHEINRDFLLWQNVKFALDNLKDNKSTVAIYSHLAHLNKKTPIFLTSIKSLGQYIDNYYGCNYFLIGLFIGEGTITTFTGKKNMVLQEIGSPDLRSIEYVCSLASMDNFYKILPLQTTPILNRSVTGYYNRFREFTAAFQEENMNALIFIRKSSGATIIPPMQK